MASAAEPMEEIKARIEMIPVDEAKREIAEGVRVIDVREQNEWDESHLEGAIHIPQAEVAERIDEVAPGHLRAPDPPLPHRQPLRADRRSPW